MTREVIIGILIPFVGTTLGSACVFLLRGDISDKLYRVLSGFASGVMIAASIWSLILPAMDEGTVNLRWQRIFLKTMGVFSGSSVEPTAKFR